MAHNELPPLNLSFYFSNNLSLTMPRKSSVTDLSAWYSRQRLRKLEKLWRSRRCSRTSDTRTANCKSWKCCITRIVSKCASLSIPTVRSRMKFISTLWWTTFRTQRTAWWRTISKWSKWCLTCSLNFTATNCFARLRIFTPRVFVTETSSRRISSLIRIRTCLNFVTSVQLNS